MHELDSSPYTNIILIDRLVSRGFKYLLIPTTKSFHKKYRFRTKYQADEGTLSLDLITYMSFIQLL